jgi:hypothetical protein
VAIYSGPLGIEFVTAKDLPQKNSLRLNGTFTAGTQISTQGPH